MAETYCPLATVEMIDDTFPLSWQNNPQHYVDKLNHGLKEFCHVGHAVNDPRAGLEAFSMCFTPRNPGIVECMSYNKLTQALGYGDLFPADMDRETGLKVLASKGKKSDARLPERPPETVEIEPMQSRTTGVEDVVAEHGRRLDRLEAWVQRELGGSK